MTKISDLQPSQVLSFFTRTFITVFFVGLGILIFLLAVTVIEEKIYIKEFCFRNSCLKYTFGLFSESIKLAQAYLSLLTAVATIGGIVAAVFTYTNSASTNALNNHISHFQIFSDYVLAESNKRDRISISSIDVFYWYNMIFKRSKEGVMTVSDGYRDAMNNLNSTIEASNERAQRAQNGSFLYKQHQTDMIESLREFKITLQRHPRNDFYEIEDQLLDLIKTVNNAFTPNSNVADLTDRSYI
ncbi:retron Ec48 family effector membrane protein [Endozoicomonas acroporae]|uniref:retron Ec48 family effector membrane protein n=1 Tax=Endozoicomonas acroporae TaxID=1701104 RepID=UPI000C783CCE|nr:retron Ec48 family effector membrane protein [Endozoicomonas acroporae]